MRLAKATPEDIKTLIDFFNELEEVDATEQGAAFVRQWGRNVSARWRRVVFGCELLIERCADPDKDYLDYHPKFNYNEQ